MRCCLTPEKRQDPALVCSASPLCSARPRWCTGVPNQTAVRISSASSSHVSSQPVIAALRLVLPHVVLAAGDDRTVEPAALLGTHTGVGGIGGGGAALPSTLVESLQFSYEGRGAHQLRSA
jgi:hypothetical protein